MTQRGDGGRAVQSSARAGLLGFRRRLRVFAYASDFDDLGPREIARQLELLDRRLSTMDIVGPGHVVDTGWRGSDDACPPALFALIRSARGRTVDVVAIETMTRLARDRGTAHRIAAILCDAGVQLLDVRRLDAVEPAARGGSRLRPFWTVVRSRTADRV